MTTPQSSRLQRYLPRVDTVTLWLFVVAFVALPIIFSWKGFAYMLGTILFAVGVRPHVERLAQDGHTLNFAMTWRGKRYEKSFRFQMSSEDAAAKLVSRVMLLFVIGIVPVVVYVLQQQGSNFVDGLASQQTTIMNGLNQALNWSREVAPGVVPQGDVAGVTGGIIGQVFGDLKKLALAISSTTLKVTGILLKDWILLVISIILLGQMMKYWRTECDRFRHIVAEGISNDPDNPLRRNIIRYCELFQEGLSVLMIGFLEVAMTLSAIYFVLMALFPFNMSLGALLLISLTLGFITAVPKAGGMVAMAVAFVIMVMNFKAGLGWFGFEVLSFGVILDVAIRTFVLLAIAKVMGLLESYNYTPKIIGAKLNLTKMQMVATILIWALGTGFFGMVWGVLIMLTFQAAQSLSNERKTEGESTTAVDTNRVA